MKPQPQPPDRRPLSQADDPASVLRDAEIPYRFGSGSDSDSDLAEATRCFVQSLNSESIPHVLVGALAMLQYVDGRTTRDIDLIIALEDLDRLPGFQLEERNEWFATGTVGPLRVDLLFTANPLFALVLEQHSELRDFLDGKLNCATPKGIILLKLFALPSLYRQGNVQRAALYETDILQLLHSQPTEAEALLSVLKNHMPPSDINALSDVLSDIQQRIDHQSRFDQPTPEN
ncbi:hypothetical protein ACFQY0_14455 [Haloferula chungangensis]|uniref:Nucleotidyltransferase family protein n=1 Tax=Haloferula chungangensis TaxID=1048331 RepID=A0ABW2L7R4_9BACT